MSEGPASQSAIGQALVDVHGTYRAQRLSHEPPDERISDVVTWAALKPHAIRFAVFYAIFLVMVPFYVVIQLVAGVTSLASDFSGESSGGGGFFGFLAGLMSLVLFVLVIAWLVSLFMPVREQIAEYGLLVEDRASSVSNAYGWVLQTARRRQSPYAFQPATVLGVPTLRAVNGRVRALIIVRTVGTDLYVGWSMWRSRSTVVIIGNLIRDVFRKLSESADAAVDMRGSTTRALRELVHSLTREGVQAALLQAPVDPAIVQEIERLPDLDATVRTMGSPSWSQPPRANPYGQGTSY